MATETAKNPKARELATLTIKSSPFAYAHLASTTLTPDEDSSMALNNPLDALTVRSYCTAALSQFLGATGAAISVDILVVRDENVWVRVPKPDLAAFCAALTAYRGLPRGGASTTLLRLQACGDWLGSLLGRAEETELWAS
ncbi:hypothetical protein QBC34DRAFT_189564 [Podospora aff. communis PSN243]|uniref:Ribonucleases P/MRP subunit Pop8-like domain-containing protein n=1 Tax=Podospora aff. communis PSN243 TaxID=3040156 RepID=A0AAV9H1T0_9PEZI|nr:hypothetical protein QBC34DRAFT_189564 [Podospora aff. communis PSN243]